MALSIQGLTPLLEVFDVAISIDFYGRLLGFQVVNTAGTPDDIGWALLRQTHGIELMLNSAYERPERPVTADPARVASHADTTLYFACPDVDAAYAHLRSHGLSVREPAVAHYGMKQFYMNDPDGYTLCFQWPHGSSS